MKAWSFVVAGQTKIELAGATTHSKLRRGRDVPGGRRPAGSLGQHMCPANSHPATVHMGAAQ